MDTVAPPRTAPASLAPEVGDTIREAEAAIARAVQVANLTNDPMRHVLEALSAHLRATHRLFADGSLTLSAAIRQAEQPAVLSPEKQDRLIHQATQAVRVSVLDKLREVRWPTFMAAAGIVFGVFLIGGASGFAGSWFWLERKPAPVFICWHEHRPDGTANVKCESGQWLAPQK
jgi:hypothetical protein